MAQGCLSVLLRLDPHINRAATKDFPLAKYGAEHFDDHVEFGRVLSHISDGVDDLLDTDKSHFGVWVRIRPQPHLPPSESQQDVISLHYVDIAAWWNTSFQSVQMT